MTRLLCVVAAGAIASGVAAQDEALLLAGPSIESAEEAATLVDHDYDGAVKRLEIPAAEAAIELLDLDEMQAAEVGRILAERAAIMDKVVIENVELLVELQSARGDQGRRREIYREITGQLSPLYARGDLREEIEAILDEPQRARYVALIDEYGQALEDQARTDAASKGERFRVRRFEAMERVGEIGRELGRSYDRQIGARTQDFERLLASLGLDEQTETEVRRLVTELGQRTALNPTREDRSRLIADIFAVLTPEQRRRAAELLRNPPA